MDEFLYSLKPIIPYLLSFPIIMIAFLLIIFIFYKMDIQESNVGFIGLFLNLNTQKTISFSFLLFYYFFIIESTFINSYSIINLYIFLSFSLLGNIIYFNLKYISLSTIFSVFIYYILYFQKIFVNYTIDVASFWYIKLLIILMGVLTIISSTIFIIKNIGYISFDNNKTKIKEKIST